ncbi:MAG: type II secretion system protein [Planctomycetaceae bacterium]|nr:MAG: type II secretion system protein [Planctomycetaceae bacterium]
MLSKRPSAGRRLRGCEGFTLIEVAIATVIIGLGVTALLTSIGAGTRANKGGQKLTQATFLAQEIREWTLRLPFKDTDAADASNPPGSDGYDPQTYVDDLDDLMNVTYNPPRDGRGQAITDMPGWSQTITMTWRNPANLASVVTAGTSKVVYVQVCVAYNAQPVLTTGWLVRGP